MKKLLICLTLILALASLSAVCASENVTEIDDAISIQDTSPDLVEENNESFTDIEEENQTDAVDETSIRANAVTGYEKFSTKFTVTLTSNGTPLVSKPVSIVIKGVKYNKVTDSNGKASVSLKLTKGTYNANFYYDGDNLTASSSGSAKITVKSPYKTKFQVADKNVNYRQGSRSIFQVRLLTTGGSPVKNQKVTIKAAGKTYTTKTNSKGYATVYLSLKQGTKKVTYSFKSSSPYLSSSGSTKLKVKAPMTKGKGYWLWPNSMYKINLKTLKNKGTKIIFLQDSVFNYYTKSAVTSWIAKANKYGIKVHIWMQVFYNGKWYKPVDGDGNIKYSMINKKVAQAKKYAKIKGVAGIHFDYVIFNGNAYKYGDSVKAINTFIKKACTEVRKVSSKCILSASVMPEPGMNEYYYGQNVGYMSKYLDAIVPMAYKGNYGKNTEWISYITQAFKLESNGAQIWTGILGYTSDTNHKKLSASSLLKDAKASIKAGAKGVFVFRIGMTHYLNFNKV